MSQSCRNYTSIWSSLTGIVTPIIIQVIETPDGVELTPYQEEFAQKIDVAEGNLNEEEVTE